VITLEILESSSDLQTGRRLALTIDGKKWGFPDIFTKSFLNRSA
jgi:hypothetical protein